MNCENKDSCENYKASKVFEAEVESSSYVFYGKFKIIPCEGGLLSYDNPNKKYYLTDVDEYRTHDFATPAERERFENVKREVECKGQKFKVGDWVVDIEDADHKPFQLSIYSLVLRPARLSDFEVERDNCKLLIWDKDDDREPWLFINGNRNEFNASCLSDKDAKLLARFMGVQIAPAGMTDEVKP